MHHFSPYVLCFFLVCKTSMRVAQNWVPRLLLKAIAGSFEVFAGQ